MNSIDFRLQIGIQSGTGLLPTLKGNLFVGHYDLPFSQLKKVSFFSLYLNFTKSFAIYKECFLGLENVLNTCSSQLCIYNKVFMYMTFQTTLLVLIKKLFILPYYLKIQIIIKYLSRCMSL